MQAQVDRLRDWARFVTWTVILTAQVPAFVGIALCYLYLRALWSLDDWMER